MALRDRFDKIISYFDTDEVSEVEEQQAPAPVKQRQPEAAQKPVQIQSQSTQAKPRPSQQQGRPNRRPSAAANDENIRQFPTGGRPSGNQPSAVQDKTTIALKFPRKYEDAEEIVDLLIRNECVLIDFQYMLEAQARRCLDFVDGASKVLYGNLQKVGSSMYLLTPANVIVDIEEMTLAANGQDVSFNYDMKRR